jgi:hypothetical protein
MAAHDILQLLDEMLTSLADQDLDRDVVDGTTLGERW